MTQPTLFISYSPQDETDKNQLITQLGVLQQQGLIDAWSDDRIGPGADWAAELEQAIGRARVAILLVTANFLSSPPLLNQAQQLLERQETAGVIIYPVIARPCVWQAVPWLAKIVRPNAKPVWREGGRYAEEELAQIAGEIAAMMAASPPSIPPSVAEGEEEKPPLPPGEGWGEGKTSAVWPAPLREALDRRSLALFIGADLPAAVTGLPARTDLARDLARRHKVVGQDNILSYSLAEVAQRVSQAGNRWAFTDFIRNALDTTAKSPQPFHQQIAALVKEHQIETVITTAYDNLLELACRQAGVGLNRVVRGSDVNFTNPDRPTLIKLYGDAQQPDTLIVTDQDHSNLLRDRDREAVIDEIRRAFRRNTILFLGYNLADPDFRFLFDQIAESRFARTAYAVWPGLPEVDMRMWRDRGIVILEADPSGLLRGTPTTATPKNQPEIPTPDLALSKGTNMMDYKLGLSQLKKCLEQNSPDTLAEFNTLAERFQKNERAEHLFGSSENTRNDHSQIIYALNNLALEYCKVSFNDLCFGK